MLQLVIYMQEIEKNQSKSLALTLEVTLCYSLSYPCKKLRRIRVRVLPEHLKYPCMCALATSMYGIGKNLDMILFMSRSLLLLVNTCMKHVRPCKSFLVGFSHYV